MIGNGEHVRGNAEHVRGNAERIFDLFERCRLFLFYGTLKYKYTCMHLDNCIYIDIFGQSLTNFIISLFAFFSSILNAKVFFLVSKHRHVVLKL